MRAPPQFAIWVFVVWGVGSGLCLHGRGTPSPTAAAPGMGKCQAELPFMQLLAVIVKRLGWGKGAPPNVGTQSAPPRAGMQGGGTLAGSC